MMDVPQRELLRNDGKNLITVTLVLKSDPLKRITLEKTLSTGDVLSFPEALADEVIVVIL